MKITVRQALDWGIWDEIADLKGLSVWAVKEGLINDDDNLEISIGEFRGLFSETRR